MAITPGVQIIEFVYPPPPSPALSDWTRVGPSDGYLIITDDIDGNGNIVDPDTDITSASRQIFGRGFVPATFVGVRMRYTGGATTSPVVKVFGRTRQPNGTAGPWQILKNRVGDSSVMIVIDPSDIVSDLGFATTADPQQAYFEVQGCNEFLVGVEVDTDAEEAALDVKFL